MRPSNIEIRFQFVFMTRLPRTQHNTPIGQQSVRPEKTRHLSRCRKYRHLQCGKQVAWIAGIAGRKCGRWNAWGEAGRRSQLKFLIAQSESSAASRSNYRASRAASVARSTRRVSPRNRKPQSHCRGDLLTVSYSSRGVLLAVLSPSPKQTARRTPALTPSFRMEAV